MSINRKMMIFSSGEEFVRIQNTIFRLKNALTRFSSTLPLSNKEFFLLMVIRDYQKNGKRITSTQLSRLFSISRAAISQFVTSLESKGYLKRIVSPDDRRMTYLETTEMSENIISKISEYFDEQVLTIKNRLGDEKFHKMLALIEETTDIIIDITEEKKSDIK